MTPEELKQEWEYRYTERLGIMCGDNKPTPEQFKIARDEADAAINNILISLLTE